MNGISKYNIIIPKQKNEKREKAGIEYETLKWLMGYKKFIKWDNNTHTFTLIKWNFTLEWM